MNQVDSKWIPTRIGDLCDITRGASPRPIHDWISPSGMPWVKISDASASGTRFISKTRECIRDEGKHKSVVVHPGDLIVSNSATPGIPMFLEIEACIHDGWLLLRNFRRLDKVYCFYLIKNERPRLLKQGNGSVFTNLKTDILKRHTVLLPSLPEQQAIAAILGALDDKIELNRKMNATLDELARTIFRSWFVDFDPVHAKAEGRAPFGMDAETAALFPDRFIDSELGPIPKGWQVKRLGEVTTELRRGISPKYVEHGGVLVLNQKCIRDGRVDTEKARRHDLSMRSIAGRQLQLGDVLVNSTGVGTLGRIAQILHLAETTICDSHVTVVRANQEVITSNTLGIGLSLRETEVEGLGHGSTGQTELSRAALVELQILVPPRNIQKLFDSLTTPLRSLSSANQQESCTLAEVRDTLLPELISGRIRVPGAEKVVAEVV